MKSDAQLAKSRIEPLTMGEFVKGFWVSPKEHPDFAWVWITRFLVILGTAFVTSYLLYFTRDVLGKSPDEAGDTVAGILQFYIIALLVFALITARSRTKSGGSRSS